MVVESPKYTSINNHTIKLVDNRQLLYSLIYGLGFMKLEMLKAYFKINLINSFIDLLSLLLKLPFFGLKIRWESKIVYKLLRSQ